MSRRTRKRLHKKKTHVIRSRKPAPKRVPSTIFWPERIDHVRAIAMMGLEDEEMAQVMGISPELLDSWKAYYPLLSRAIEEGRTNPDAQVVAALHKSAVGYNYDEDVVVRSRKGASVVTATKYQPGDVSAQKFWLQNRQKDRWNQTISLEHSGKKGGAPIAISQESKLMVIHSILNMISPRPDGDPRPVIEQDN